MSHLTRSFNLKDKDYIEKHIDLIKEKLAKQGYHLTAQLGAEHGAYGLVFETSEGQALKITTDDDEWNTSAKLLKKKLKHVVEIHRVFMLKSIPGVAFILQEKLFPLNEEETLLVDDLSLKGSDTAKMADVIAKHYQLDSIGDLETYFSDRTRSETEGKAKWKAIEPYIKNLTHAWSDFSSQVRGFFALSLFNYAWVADSREIQRLDNNIPFMVKLLDTLNDLVDNKIHFTDTHSHNLMQDSSGTLKWIDLGGGSKASGVSQMEHIEGQSKKAILENLHEIRNKLKNIGYSTKVLRHKGEGSRGIALETDGKILKITSDKSEALISSKLIGKDLKRVVKIFRVFMLKSMPNIYFILQEQLKPISADQLNIVDNMYFRGTPDYKLWVRIAKKYKLKAIEDFLKYYQDTLSKPDKQSVSAIYKNITQIRNLSDAFRGFFATYPTKLLQETWVIPVALEHTSFVERMLSALQELIQNNIVFEDATGSNLMKSSKGIYKWIDLGYSAKGPGKSKVERLEGFCLTRGEN